MKALDWSKIKNNYAGFEELAYQFVSKRFESPSGWTHSQETWDNNRDAYTVILGYQPYVASPEQWWMEAKYSVKSERLSRYRLDATIVSAILAKDVTKVIFVTNVVISAKVMTDIRSALIHAIGCREVYFFSKHTLEYWLSQNPDILKDFFPEYVDTLEIELAPCFITEELEYYSEPEHQLSFREPLQCLYKGRKYYGYFSAFSNKKRALKIKPAPHLSGIEILSPSRMLLENGENPLHIEFFINEDFVNTNPKKSEVLSFMLGKQVLLSKHNIIPESARAKIKVKEQNAIKKELLTSINLFRKKSEPQIHLLTGISCIGKSYLIDELLSDSVLSTENVYSVEFMDSSLTNIELIINSILFILLPYVAPTDIDINYMDKLQFNMEMSNILYEFVRYKSDFEQLESIINNLNESNIFFPVKMSINRRVIFFDDVSKLKPQYMSFLCFVIKEIYDRKLPIFVVLCGQPQLLSGLQPLQQKIYIENHKYVLSSQTILECINDICYLNFKPDSTIIQTIFPNLIEMFSFIAYLKDTHPQISSVEEFIYICKIYQRSGIWEKSLVNIFRNLYTQRPDCFQLCANIYWSYNGILVNEIPESHKENLNQLFIQNLIKTNKEGLLVPFHDVYVKIFRGRYPLKDCDIFMHTKNEVEGIQDIINFSLNTSDFLNATKKLESLCDSQKFYTLLYILEEFFETSTIDEAKNRFGERIFYRLYRLYALAITNLSRDQSGKALFEKIYFETINSLDGEILMVCTSVIWELINSYYEWMNFEQSKFYASELIKVIHRLQQFNSLDKNINKFVRYHNMLVIQTLIESEKRCIGVENNFIKRYQTMRDYGFLERAATFKVRYAHTLLHRDISQAKHILREGMKEIIDVSDITNKFYLWASTSCYFIELITEEKNASLSHLLNEHEKMKKNYFNDYRKRSIAIASYYFSVGEIELGKRYIFDNITIERELRPRQRGFYCELMALYELYNAAPESSLKYLVEAENIFNGLSDYQKIIMHNKDIIKSGTFLKNKIKFCFSLCLEEGYFYLDPRCIY